jgi:hypothetical protein
MSQKLIIIKEIWSLLVHVHGETCSPKQGHILDETMGYVTTPMTVKCGHAKVEKNMEPPRNYHHPRQTLISIWITGTQVTNCMDL